MIKVGDKCEYLGIQLKVVETQSDCVVLDRVGSKDKGIKLFVMRNSTRYFTIFPNEKPQTQLFITTDKQTIKYKILWRNAIITNENSELLAFIKRFSNVGKENIKKMGLQLESTLKNDSSGIALFAIATFLYRNKATKWHDCQAIAKYLHNKPIIAQDCYTPQLLDFYIKSLSDSNKATNAEIDTLATLLPKNDLGSFILAISGNIYIKHIISIASFKLHKLFNLYYAHRNNL